MEKKTKLRTIREKKNMSILELSRRSGVSFEKVRQLDRGIKVDSTGYKIKQQIADALDESVLSVFYEIMDQRVKEMSKGQKLFMTIKVFLPDLRLTEKEQALWEKTLDKMTREEFGEIIKFGIDVKYCKQRMDHYLRIKNPLEYIP